MCSISLVVKLVRRVLLVTFVFVCVCLYAVQNGSVNAAHWSCVSAPLVENIWCTFNMKLFDEFSFFFCVYVLSESMLHQRHLCGMLTQLKHSSHFVFSAYRSGVLFDVHQNGVRSCRCTFFLDLWAIVNPMSWSFAAFVSRSDKERTYVIDWNVFFAGAGVCSSVLFVC